MAGVGSGRPPTGGEVCWLTSHPAWKACGGRCTGRGPSPWSELRNRWLGCALCPGPRCDVPLQKQRAGWLEPGLEGAEMEISPPVDSRG